MLTYIRLVITVDNSGNLLTSIKTNSLRLSYYGDSLSYFRAFCECWFIIISFIYVARKIYEMYQEYLVIQKKFFKDKNRSTCVSSGNSSSSEAKPRWKDGRGFNSAQGPLLIPLNRLLNFWFWSDEFEKQARTRKVTSTVRGSCIRYIGHRLMIPYTGEGMGKERVDK